MSHIALVWDRYHRMSHTMADQLQLALKSLSGRPLNINVLLFHWRWHSALERRELSQLMHLSVFILNVFMLITDYLSIVCNLQRFRSWASSIWRQSAWRECHWDRRTDRQSSCTQLWCELLVACVVQLHAYSEGYSCMLTVKDSVISPVWTGWLCSDLPVLPIVVLF